MLLESKANTWFWTHLSNCLILKLDQLDHWWHHRLIKKKAQAVSNLGKSNLMTRTKHKAVVGYRLKEKDVC